MKILHIPSLSISYSISIPQCLPVCVPYPLPVSCRLAKEDPLRWSVRDLVIRCHRFTGPKRFVYFSLTLSLFYISLSLIGSCCYSNFSHLIELIIFDILRSSVCFWGGGRTTSSGRDLSSSYAFV